MQQRTGEEKAPGLGLSKIEFIALAAALPELPYACGLATARLLAADVVAEPLLPVAGAIPVRRPEPDPGLLAAAAEEAERSGVAARWAERLAAIKEAA